jgi:hypothetical protein
MSGIRLLLDKLKHQPGHALRDLALDYATYFAMCLFIIWLWVMRGPIELLGLRRSRSVRRALIDAVARAARG